MQDRKISMEARPTFQYIKLVAEFISFVSDVLKDNKLKGLRPIQAALDSLSRTVQDPSGKMGVKPALKISEATRNESLGTPDSLDKEYDKAVKEKQKADDAYNKLPQQHEENLNKQKRLRDATVEDMSLDELKKIGITAKENQQLIIKYEELDLKLNTKRDELKKLDAKIQSHCCGGALCNKDDLIRRRNIDHEINVLIALQQTVKDNPVSAEPTKGDVADWKKQLARLRKDIQDEIDGYETKRKKAQKVVDAAAKKISEINQKIDEQQLDQCRMVDRDTMFNLVHLRARFSSFYRLVDKVYKDDPSTKQVLDAIISARSEWRVKLNGALGAIFYPVLEGRSGMQLYSTYTDWAKTHEQEQREIESAEYSPNEYIAAVVPEVMKEEARVLRTSSLGTVHDFFPTADMAKKKKSAGLKSSEPAATATGLKVSSSSTTS